MSHNPSLAVLFRRGFHAGHEAKAVETFSEQARKKIDQKELFAVAAVAFVLKYDLHFKTHFLEKICGIKNVNLDSLPDYEVIIQDGNFADLLLLNERKSEVIAIEFKIDAHLQPHQNFDKEKDFREYDGYGSQILCSKYRDYKSLKYIVLLKNQKRDELNLSEASIPVNGILCYSRVWHDLLCPKNEETPLMADLFDCLSQALNIGELKSRIYMNKKMSKSVQDAVAIYDILQSFGFNKPTTGKDEKSFWFGVNISRSAKGFDLIKNYSSSDTDPFCWFGYEHLENGQLSERKSIWIYGISKDSRKVVEDLFQKSFGGKNQIQSSGDSVVIFPQNESETAGDIEWFQSVIDTLKHLRK